MTRFSLLSRLSLFLTLVLGMCLGPMLRAQQPAAPATPADQAAAAALDLANSGKTKEAIDAYTAIVKNFPTASVVSEAQFRIGYLNYLLGNYDASIAALQKILAPPAPPEIQELAYNLLPQVYTGKASKLPPDDPKRTAAYEDAIKQFDVFLQKFPTSDQAESAIYGRALALFQMGKYDEAAKNLRANLQKFTASESILESQYLLALTLAAEANQEVRGPSVSAQTRQKANGEFDESVKFLQDIVQRRTDPVLANDAQFQIGEILFARAEFAEPAQRDALFTAAINAYRSVEPKEIMVKMQEQRIAGMLQRIRAAAAARNVREIKRLQRLQEHEQAKLPVVEGAEGKAVAAQIKVGMVFFTLQKFDAARVLLQHYVQFATSEEQKKEILYFVTMSYISQVTIDTPPLAPATREELAQKGITGFDEFQKAYKNDPMAENLPYALGSMFLVNDPKINNPAKAIQYFDESLKNYPKGHLFNESMSQEASALIQLKRYDEATNLFKKFLATNPSKEQAAGAEFGLATIYRDQNKTDAAIAAFKNIRDKYPATPQGEQAAFWVGQMLLTKGDAKAAVPELQRYIKSFPDAAQIPTAIYTLGQAQTQANDKAGAMQTYKDLETKFPKSEAAPYAYFARATIFAGQQKVKEMLDELRAFITNYPDSDKIYFAYDSIAQNLVNAQKTSDAIATYLEMAEKHPKNPQAPAALYQAAELSRRGADSIGRYIALNEKQRSDWNKGIAASMESAEKLIEQYPDSEQVALGLQTLLNDQKMLLQAKQRTAAQVDQYFQQLAEKFASKPATKSKILFALAAFTYEQDKAKALVQMQAAYNPKLVYAPADLDLYGSALLENGKAPEAMAIYQKLATDFPNPAGVSPDKAPPQIAEAQATALYGIGKALQKEGKIAEAGKKFDELKKLYPWSPKILEANFGIAQSIVQQNKLDEAMNLLVQIIRAPTATAELRANSMLLGAQIQEKKNAFDAAIDYYLKIAVFYEAVAPAAAEGLWRGGQLLEAQAATLPESSSEKDKPTKPGQMAKAIRAYKDLVAKYPNSPLASKAKDRLSQLGQGT